MRLSAKIIFGAVILTFFSSFSMAVTQATTAEYTKCAKACIAKSGNVLVNALTCCQEGIEHNHKTNSYSCKNKKITELADCTSKFYNSLTHCKSECLSKHSTACANPNTNQCCLYGCVQKNGAPSCVNGKTASFADLLCSKITIHHTKMALKFAISFAIVLLMSFVML